jgi:hypothetical protein
LPQKNVQKHHPHLKQKGKRRMRLSASVLKIKRDMDEAVLSPKKYIYLQGENVIDVFVE